MICYFFKKGLEPDISKKEQISSEAAVSRLVLQVAGSGQWAAPVREQQRVLRRRGF
jgi:hypothetical protein